jgi:hypothetical protein
MLDKDFYSNDTSSEVIHALKQAKEGVLHRISDVCGIGNILKDESVPLNDSQPQQQQEKIKWNYYNSVFFAFTVVTTIGMK